ncbi:uncharacterized protein LOC123264723 [Cotesia glomerata]|uniref:uncharacterized protein LOC123264723 n=1 Tax=Cotesia glomerata TaxID=32391 RepID=UPI001D002355|nr:uncharacterized protein LOC123264723 [Cotesia glomerata]
MRTLGLGLASCNKFCGLMDIASSFLSKQSYLDLMKSICCSIETTAEKFLVSAADKEKQLTRANSESDTLTVSGDGTWQKQGFSSSFGVTSLIGYWSGKVIDIFIGTKNMLEKMNAKQITPDHQIISGRVTVNTASCFFFKTSWGKLCHGLMV